MIPESRCGSTQAINIEYSPSTGRIQLYPAHVIINHTNSSILYLAAFSNNQRLSGRVNNYSYQVMSRTDLALEIILGSSDTPTQQIRLLLSNHLLDGLLFGLTDLHPMIPAFALALCDPRGAWFALHILPRPNPTQLIAHSRDELMLVLVNTCYQSLLLPIACNQTVTTHVLKPFRPYTVCFDWLTDEWKAIADLTYHTSTPVQLTLTCSTQTGLQLSVEVSSLKVDRLTTWTAVVMLRTRSNPSPSQPLFLLEPTLSLPVTPTSRTTSFFASRVPSYMLSRSPVVKSEPTDPLVKFRQQQTKLTWNVTIHSPVTLMLHSSPRSPPFAKMSLQLPSILLVADPQVQQVVLEVSPFHLTVYLCDLPGKLCSHIHMGPSSTSRTSSRAFTAVWHMPGRLNGPHAGILVFNLHTLELDVDVRESLRLYSQVATGFVDRGGGYYGFSERNNGSRPSPEPVFSRIEMSSFRLRLAVSELDSVGITGLRSLDGVEIALNSRIDHNSTLATAIRGVINSINSHVLTLSSALSLRYHDMRSQSSPQIGIKQKRPTPSRFIRSMMLAISSVVCLAHANRGWATVCSGAGSSIISLAALWHSQSLGVHQHATVIDWVIYRVLTRCVSTTGLLTALGKDLSESLPLTLFVHVTAPQVHIRETPVHLQIVTRISHVHLPRIQNSNIDGSCFDDSSIEHWPAAVYSLVFCVRGFAIHNLFSPSTRREQVAYQPWNVVLAVESSRDNLSVIVFFGHNISLENGFVTSRLAQKVLSMMATSESSNHNLERPPSPTPSGSVISVNVSDTPSHLARHSIRPSGIHAVCFVCHNRYQQALVVHTFKVMSMLK